MPTPSLTIGTSWGGTPAAYQTPHPVRSRLESLPRPPNQNGMLPYGWGRSYGDCCLNEDGLLLDTRALDHWIHFDRHTGIVRCEAGLSLDAILSEVVPAGWFLPVSPGTRYVTIGGAVANDVHGKDHHLRGTFGCHVRCLELLRSDGGRLFCSPEAEADMFNATIGGLGLTGLITWVEIQLIPMASPHVDVERIRYDTLSDFFSLSEESEASHEFTVAWIDGMASGNDVGRGVFMRGNFAPALGDRPPVNLKGPRRGIPFHAPGFALNRWTVSAFNAIMYRKAGDSPKRQTEPYVGFFYPLDGIDNWNRMYGKRGFFQHQCVLPPDNAEQALAELLNTAAKSAQASFLAVLKRFGDIPSPGLLSFPRPGYTLALDFPNRGQETLELLDDMDRIVFEAGGALYPAKDARMKPEHFAASFPNHSSFIPHIDPAFSSSFWRRVSPSPA